MRNGTESNVVIDEIEKARIRAEASRSPELAALRYAPPAPGQHIIFICELYKARGEVSAAARHLADTLGVATHLSEGLRERITGLSNALKEIESDISLLADASEQELSNV